MPEILLIIRHTTLQRTVHEERREACVMVLAEAGANIRCKNSAGEVALESVPARIREQIE